MEAEVGRGGEWLSESSGSLGVTRSLWAGHSPAQGMLNCLSGCAQRAL